jgi:hypothetical protein
MPFHLDSNAVIAMTTFIFPLIVYLVAAIPMNRRLTRAPGYQRRELLKDKRATSVTLAGLSFAALAFVASFVLPSPAATFGDPRERLLWYLILAFESGSTEQVVITGQVVIIVLAIAIGSFFAAYMVLRYPERTWADFFSDGLIDTGLWCILVSIYYLFGLMTIFPQAENIGRLLLVLFPVGVMIHVSVYCKRNW